MTEFTADIGINIGNLIRIGGNLDLRKAPNGVLNFGISGASVAIDIEAEGDFDNGEFSLGYSRVILARSLSRRISPIRSMVQCSIATSSIVLVTLMSSSTM